MATIEKELIDLKLSNFESYNLSQLFFSLSEHDRISPNKNLVTSKRLFLRLFFETDKWVFQKGKGKLLFFLQNSSRSDVINLVGNVVDIVDDRSFIYLTKTNSIHLFKSLKYIKLFILWKYTLKKETSLSKIQIRKVINILIRISKLSDQLKLVDFSKYNLLINFYDAEPIGNFMAQTLMKFGCTTATLSHGVVLSERDNTVIDYSGIELKGFISDYFLAWNRFSKREALKQGIGESKIKILGIPKFINFESSQSNSIVGIIGVILDNKSGDKYNRILIEMANKFCEKNSYFYLIRFHPSFSGSEYDNIINSKFYLGIDKSDSIDNYRKGVEFTLIANSTVFIELVYIGHKVYRYGSKDIWDKYRDFYYNTFSNFDQFQNLFINKINDSEELFNELCTIKDVKKSYSLFLENFNR
tara:strand:- start:3528 stop:4772 length:1245 start_codon:yes stop_codon:yes gene_type:complete